MWVIIISLIIFFACTNIIIELFAEHEYQTHSVIKIIYDEHISCQLDKLIYFNLIINNFLKLLNGLTSMEKIMYIAL